MNKGNDDSAVTGVEDNPSSYTIETETFTLKNPSREGYIFTGWSLADGSGTSKEYQIQKGTIGDITLLANWEKDTNVSYTVKAHYMVDGKYNEDSVLTDKRTGTAGEDAEVSKNDKWLAQKTADMVTQKDCHYVIDTDKTNLSTEETDENVYVKTIKGNGTTTFDIYYKQQYDITFAPGAKAATDSHDVKLVADYGTDLTKEEVKNFDAQSGYRQSGWDTELDSRVTAHKTYTAQYETITYHIAYELNKGTVEGTNPVSYTVETAPQTLINPERTGYTFTGWTVKGQLGEPNRKQMTPLQGTSDITYVANYTPNTDTEYSILYKTEQLDGKYKIYDSKDCTGVSDAEIAPEPIEIEGFTTPAIQTTTIRPDGNLVINYLYKRNAYKIYWNLKDGTAENAYTEGEAKYESEVTAPENVKKDGYTFTGWDAEPVVKMPAKEVEYTALYDVNTYAIRYELNGGEVSSESEPEPTSYTIEDTKALPQPVKQGYVFAGWCEKEDCSDDPIQSIEPGMFGDKTFYAKWNHAMDTKYTVEYYKQQLDGNYAKEADDVDVLQGETTTTVVPETKDYVGFTAPETQKLTIVASGAAVCKYYYTRNSYEITWNLGDGEADDTIPYTSGKVLYQDKITAPVVANKPAYSVSFTPEVPDVMGAADATYTAVYTPNTYKISYEYNGGDTPDTADVPTEYNTEQEILAESLGTLQRTGYEFAGWCFDKELTKPVIGSAIHKGDYGDKIFYAKWEPVTNVKYTVEHYKESLDIPGEYEETPCEVDHMTGHTDETVTPEVKNYEGFTAPETKSATVSYDETTVIKYYYKRNSYKLTWKVGDTNLTDELRYGKDIIVPPEVERDRYTFIGWDKEVLKKMPARDLVYTAQYKPQYYIHVTVPEKQTGYTLTVSDKLLAENGKTTVTFRLKDHYAKSANFAVLANGRKIELDENGTCTLTDITEDTDITVTGVVDAVDPTGKVIVPGEYVNKPSDVFITAEDTESGVAKIEYLLTDHAMTTEEMQKVEDDSWKVYEKAVTLPSADGTYVVCARITDKDGNQGYVCSDSVIVDMTVPKLTGVENGKIYCDSVNVKAEDANLAYILLDGAYISNVTEYKITADNDMHTIRAVDKAGNISDEIKVTVNTDHHYGQPVFHWSKDYSTAEAVFTCEVDSSHVKTVECDIMKETVQPSEEEHGKTVYKAVVSLNGKKYYDTKETTIVPSATPSNTPSAVPSTKPSNTPSAEPSATQSSVPTTDPSTTPSEKPSAAPSAAPTQQPVASDSTKPASSGAITISASAEEKNALALNAGLKVSQTGSRITIRWGKVTGASGYDVYVQYCGKKFTAKSITQVKTGKKTSVIVTRVNGKKLNLKKNYKIYVQAYKIVDGKKVILGKTITAHIVGRKNDKNTNVRGIKLEQSKYTLTVGKTADIKAKTLLVDKKKKPLSNAHAKELRYATSNKAVATVSSTGQIKAVKKGSCIVYVYARNGYAKAIKVTVK